MQLSTDLLARLVCPISKQPLIYLPPGIGGADGLLISAGARVAFRIEHGVPVLLADEARALPAEELEAFLSVGRAQGVATGNASNG